MPEGTFTMDGFMAVSSIYVGLNGLLMLVLAYLVTSQRQKGKSVGDEGFDHIQRAHANNTEYVPMGLLLIIALEFLGGPFLLLHGLGVALTVGRALHGYGMNKAPGRTFGRFYGTLVTWIMFLVGSVSVLFYALT